jgi:hypothetical protein
MAKLPAVVKGVTLLIYDLLISSTCSWHIWPESSPSQIKLCKQNAAVVNKSQVSMLQECRKTQKLDSGAQQNFLIVSFYVDWHALSITYSQHKERIIKINK